MGKPFILCLLALSSLFGADSAASIERYLKAPFASELSAAPGGGKVAWILDEHGARNLWVAAAPDYKGRRLTSYTEDDGQDLGDIAWSADGRFLVYVRGGDFDTNGDVPNPRNLPDTPEQTIYAIAFDGGAPHRLSDGRGPAVSRDGRVAFLKNGQIWMTTLDGAKPAEAIHTKASSEDLQWSPDGAALVFRSYRGDHSFIGMYRIANKTVTYLDPSVDRDTSPVWSPDSRRIAFVRRAYSSAISVGPAREAATPWSIRVADATTGAGREAWRAEKGPGSAFRGIEAQTQILWADGDRLVFPWERDGWLHLYTVAADGGRAQLLTPGEFEVEHVSLSRNRREVLFSSNQDDIDRRHVWRVAAAGGKPTALLGAQLGEGIEWQPADVADGALAFLRSSATEISRAAVKIGGGPVRDLAPDSIPADFPKELVKPQQVIFPASDGLTIHGQLFLPPSGGSAKHAAVIFFHGGSRRQMLLGYHYRRYYSNAYAMNQYLAARGFVVLSVNYRSGIGYGLNFREALNFGNAGGSEYNDVMGAGLYMAGRADVDPRRIGVWGGSYGGYLTALALARASNLFAAGVDMHGVHDWSIRSDRSLTALNADELREIERTALQSSPLADVKNWHSPVLLIHGDDDRNVAFNQTVRLVEALRAQGVEFEELIFPGEVHEFLLEESWIKAYRAAGDFLARKLKP
ncbi:MAG: peptidase prolyl oligopeptidase active site domain protein [Bryobacterales bacterium]|nr:peptidase prolyl oligopeptidase active site domain protein [Bryobacterales bacterium]